MAKRNKNKGGMMLCFNPARKSGKPKGKPNATPLVQTSDKLQKIIDSFESTNSWSTKSWSTKSVPWKVNMTAYNHLFELLRQFETGDKNESESIEKLLSALETLGPKIRHKFLARTAVFMANLTKQNENKDQLKKLIQKTSTEIQDSPDKDKQHQKIKVQKLLTAWMMLDDNLCFQHIKSNPEVLEMRQDLKEDEAFMLTALAQNPAVWDKLPDSFKEKKEFKDLKKCNDILSEKSGKEIYTELLKLRKSHQTLFVENKQIFAIVCARLSNLDFSCEAFSKGATLGKGKCGEVFESDDSQNDAIKELFPIENKSDSNPQTSAFEKKDEDFEKKDEELRVVQKFVGECAIYKAMYGRCAIHLSNEGVCQQRMPKLETELYSDYLHKKGRTINIKDKIEIITAIFKQLQNIHKKGLYHRDIKSEHIMFGKQGEVYIVDFGISYVNMEDNSAAQKFPLGGHLQEAGKRCFCGTPCYLRPSFIDENKRFIDDVNLVQNDLHACCVLACEILLDGSMPFVGKGKDIDSLFENIKKQEAGLSAKATTYFKKEYEEPEKTLKELIKKRLTGTATDTEDPVKDTLDILEKLRKDYCPNPYYHLGT